MIRILKIVGKSEAARLYRLGRVEEWMTAHGWNLADYSEEAGSAMFERADEAPSIGFFHPTRWMPGPQALKPRELLLTARTEPRIPLIALGAVLALWVGLALLFSPPDFSGFGGISQQQEEDWRYVNVSALNVRAEPTSQSPPVGIFYRNQRVQVESVQEGWARVLKPVRGYVSAKYLQDVPAE